MKCFSMAKNSSNIEWCIYDMDNNDYSFSLNKENIRKIKDWEEYKTIMYQNSWSLNSLEDIQYRMKKSLILWLLSDEERRKNMTDALVKNHTKESNEVIINISKSLLDTLLEFEWWLTLNEYRYNMRWDKMYFYVNDSYYKQCLNDNIEFFNNLFDQKFSKK